MPNAQTPPTTATPPAAPRGRQAKPKRPTHLPHGRWLGDFPKLSDGEAALVTACALGNAWGPTGWDGSRPDAATPANTIRAELIRFLVLEGDVYHPVHEQGVMVRGAWISGELNLHQVEACLRLDAKHCHFDAAPNFMQATLPELSLIGSKCPGLTADRVKVAGSLFLRDGFHAAGEVRLLGAEIGGNLDCSAARIENAGGDALNADRATVTGSLYLYNGFHATGAVRLLGAQIGGMLTCRRGQFENANGPALSADRVRLKGSLFLHNGFQADGGVRLLGAQIGGDLVCSKGRFEHADGDALVADGVTLKGGLFLRDAKITGAIQLAVAKVGTLVDGDDVSLWKDGRHVLDGFTYDRIIGFTDAKQRIGWLAKQRGDHLKSEFKPQPWEQLIKVLRDMGHMQAASDVAVAKQKQMYVAGVIEGRRHRGLHWLYGLLAGYGHRPMNTIVAMILVWFACTAFFYGGREVGLMGPSSPLIHASQQWTACGAPGELDASGSQKPYWATQCTLPSEYTTLQPALYSLDLILPLVDLQQEHDWSPIVSNEAGQQLWWGHGLRVLMWFEILFGWAMSLMLVAVMGRLVDKD